MACPDCEALTINGVYCHETGCPLAWKDKVLECRNCGDSYKGGAYDGDPYCSDGCFREHNHYPLLSD